MLPDAPIKIFETLNKIEMARDKLARWKQIKNYSSFNEDLRGILPKISNITIEDQIKRFAGGLKPCIWRVLYTKEYSGLGYLMRDAEDVGSAHRLQFRNTPKISDDNEPKSEKTNGPVLMEIGYVQLRKWSPAESGI